MWVVTGLGNPGRRYRGTRHNVGFRVIDVLSERLDAGLSEKRKYVKGEGLYGDELVVLIKPLTFMNLSGAAVREVLRRRRCSHENLIVVHDDLDIPVGRIKIKKKGSSGGHRGVQSIIDHIGTEEFIRVKVGIGRPPGVPPEVYVLGPFRPEEREAVEGAIKSAADAVLTIIEKGVDRAMTEYNR